MTAKEIFLELLKPDGKPERQLIQYEALQMEGFHTDTDKYYRQADIFIREGCRERQ